MEERVYRAKVVEQFLIAGIPLKKIDSLRDLLEENALRLTHSLHLSDYIAPLQLKTEHSQTNWWSRCLTNLRWNIEVRRSVSHGSSILCWVEYQAEIGAVFYASKIIKWGRDCLRNPYCSFYPTGNSQRKPYCHNERSCCCQQCCSFLYSNPLSISNRYWLS